MVRRPVSPSLCSADFLPHYRTIFTFMMLIASLRSSIALTGVFFFLTSTSLALSPTSLANYLPRSHLHAPHHWRVHPFHAHDPRCRRSVRTHHRFQRVVRRRRRTPHRRHLLLCSPRRRPLQEGLERVVVVSFEHCPGGSRS
jgi:hypothetical protein